MKNIRLLEDRVARAVKRLGQLSEERERLRKELQVLRRQLEGLRQTPSQEAEAGEEDWTVEKARVAAVIRDTLEGLCAD